LKNFDPYSFHNRGGAGCPTLKTTMENTNYENWQLEKYGNVIGAIESTPDGELYESGIEELNRLAEWMNEQAERQLEEQE